MSRPLHLLLPDVLLDNLAIAARRNSRTVEREIEYILRQAMQDGSGLTCGALMLDAAGRKAWWRGIEVTLTRVQFDQTWLLASRAGEVITWRALYDVVHGVGIEAGNEIDGIRGNVRSMVKRLRHVFQAVEPNFDAIQVQDGIGYRWDAAREKTGPTFEVSRPVRLVPKEAVANHA